MKKNNKKGFTLVELVIVVAVMAVLVAVAIPTVSSITNSAKNAVDDSNARTIESVLKLAEANAVRTTDGAVTLTGAEMETALDAAKLGITGARDASGNVTSKNFYYNPTTGVVKSGTSAPSADFTYTFAFDANGVCTVTPQT